MFSYTVDDGVNTPVVGSVTLVTQTAYIENNGQFYQDFGTGTIAEAEALATTEEGYVVKIEDAIENTFVASLSSGDIWINATDREDGNLPAVND